MATVRARLARRRPKQTRSRATQDLIFEAATQILEREGERAFNTNRLAERAGVSVGTIYQYFPNKEAILIAMARREQERLELDTARLAGRDVMRLSIRRLIWVLEGKPATRRAIVRASIAGELSSTHGAAIDRTANQLPLQKGYSRLDAFVMTRAVVGVVRAAVLEGYPGLARPEFEDALLRLVRGYERAKR
ncbi:MAG: TetR/AcrR family transcriptional regulator [Alphaproteobacteria bacterium]|nr:TetR/AcrR family transcriptional regulator [Alphaproteobacteria bacterium]